MNASTGCILVPLKAVGLKLYHRLKNFSVSSWIDRDKWHWAQCKRRLSQWYGITNGNTNRSSLDSLGYFVWPKTMTRHSVTSQSVVFYRYFLMMQWMHMSIQPSPNVRNTINTPGMHNPMHWIKMSTSPKRDQGSCHNHFPVQIRRKIQNSIWPTIAKSYFNNSSKKWGLTDFILWTQVKLSMDLS